MDWLFRYLWTFLRLQGTSWLHEFVITVRSYEGPPARPLWGQRLRFPGALIVTLFAGTGSDAPSGPFAGSPSLARVFSGGKRQEALTA